VKFGRTLIEEIMGLEEDSAKNRRMSENLGNRILM